MLYYCQLLSVVGSGFLTQSITKLFGSESQGVWFSQVLVILTVAVTPPVSQAVDYWGRKWFVVILGSMGCVGCIIVSRAHNIATVTAGFTVIGVSFGCQSVLMAIVSEILPRKHRPFAQATINATASLGGISGVVMGGLLLRHGALQNYRIYFYVNAAIFGVASIGCALCYNPPPREFELSMTNAQKLRQLDWIGYLLCAPGLALFSIALSWSRNPYTWTDAHILAPFIIGVVMMIIFGVYEWRFKKDGMLHHGLFRNRNFAIAMLAIFAEGMTFFTINSYFAFQVVTFTGADLLIAGLHYAVLFAVATPVPILAGAYSSWRKEVRSPIVLGFVLFVIFNILMTTTTPSSPKGVYWGYPVIIGAGIGTCLPGIMVAAQLSTPPDLIALASGLMIAFRSVGATIALAVNNAIFNSALSTEIPAKLAAATLPLGLPRSSLGPLIQALTSNDQAGLAQIPGVSEEIVAAAGAALKAAYGVGFRNCWIAATCFSAIAIMAGLCIAPSPSEFNHHIDAPAESELLEIQRAIESKHVLVHEVEMTP
ncbi:major facilitator superfamily domain-containing protein [Leptodontidium sp. MPI-SDFR-AT-0119]|nr:major facilitator superfamily domain-containing protein [Leptodontidium sp. MPI-SDFR-AT-0119]